MCAFNFDLNEIEMSFKLSHLETRNNNHKFPNKPDYDPNIAAWLKYR